ncbi:MAG: cache domain-containing protein, partial [Lachnoclostridium sp.]|nr:cache domain-containing protein [Lachnoclostridium sp.]
MSIKSKILIPMIAIMLLIAAAILISNSLLFSGFVDDDTVRKVNTAKKVVINNLENHKVEAKAASSCMAINPMIINAVMHKNRIELQSHVRSLQEETGIDFCTITDVQGEVIIRTHVPEKFGDSIISHAVIQAAVYGESLTTIDKGTEVLLAVCSGMPIYNENKKLVGVVTTGFRLDTERFVDSIKEMVGCEASVIVGDERISTTILGEGGTRAVGTKVSVLINENILSESSFTRKLDVLGYDTVMNYIPIKNLDGIVIGMIFIGHYTKDKAMMIGTFIQNGLIITFVMLIISKRVLEKLKITISEQEASIKEEYERIKEIVVEIEERDHMYYTVNQTANMLLCSETDNFEKILYDSMDIIIKGSGADRMYIFKNHMENGQLYYTQIYEWSRNTHSLQAGRSSMPILYDENAPEIKRTLSNGDCYHHRIQDMPASDQAQFIIRGTLVVMLIPVFIHSEFWGFVGFENCHTTKMFTKIEESIVSSGSLLIANALLRNEYVDSLHKTKDELEIALTEAENAN